MTSCWVKVTHPWSHNEVTTYEVLGYYRYNNHHSLHSWDMLSLHLMDICYPYTWWSWFLTLRRLDISTQYVENGLLTPVRASSQYPSLVALNVICWKLLPTRDEACYQRPPGEHLNVIRWDQLATRVGRCYQRALEGFPDVKSWKLPPPSVGKPAGKGKNLYDN